MFAEVDAGNRRPDRQGDGESAEALRDKSEVLRDVRA
jgi:hypothetical protein